MGDYLSLEGRAYTELRLCHCTPSWLRPHLSETPSQKRKKKNFVTCENYYEFQASIFLNEVLLECSHSGLFAYYLYILVLQWQN